MIRLFIGYVIYAGIATIVDFVTLYSLTEYADVWYFYSAIIASIMGMATNYFLNKYLNFKNTSRAFIRQSGIFVSVAIVTIIINQTILYILVEFTGLWYITARVISTGIALIWSFWGHKNLTFKLYT